MPRLAPCSWQSLFLQAPPLPSPLQQPEEPTFDLLHVITLLRICQTFPLAKTWDRNSIWDANPNYLLKVLQMARSLYLSTCWPDPSIQGPPLHRMFSLAYSVLYCYPVPNYTRSAWISSTEHTGKINSYLLIIMPVNMNMRLPLAHVRTQKPYIYTPILSTHLNTKHCRY